LGIAVTKQNNILESVSEFQELIFCSPLPEGWIRLWRRRRSIPQLERCSFSSCKKGATPVRFFSKPVPLFTLSFLFFPTQFPSTKTKKDAVAIGAKLKVHFFI